MKQQIIHANSNQDRISIDFGWIEVLDKARFGPKMGFLGVVSSHPTDPPVTGLETK